MTDRSTPANSKRPPAALGRSFGCGLALAFVLAVTVTGARADENALAADLDSTFEQSLHFRFTTVNGSTIELMEGPADGLGSYADVCSVIFPTEAVAEHYCPAGRPPVIAYDFWKNQPLGWSCDCASH